MRTRRRHLVAVLAIAFAVLAVIAVVRHQSSTLPDHRRPSQPEVPAALRSVPLTDWQQPASRKNESSPSASPTVRMARELAKAADLRNFAVAARQRPQEGGYVYASGAANYCSFIRHYVKSLREKHAAAAASSNKPTVLQRLQTLDRMEARCQSFTDAELVELGSNEFRREGLARGDPLLRVQHDLWGGQQHIPPRDTEKQRAFLTALIDAGDPWLLDSLRGVAQVWEANAKDPSSYLDGVRFGGLSGTAAYFDAWDLVQCTIGESCDKLNQPEVEVACVEKGTCFEDRFQLIRHNLKDRPGEYEKLMAVYTRLLEIVRIRDVNALLPPDRLKGYRFG